MIEMMRPSEAESCFHRTYEEARHAFISATADLNCESFQYPAIGRNGELLALDVALQGNINASNMLIVSSGCHGVEGFCGSGVQIACLKSAEFQRYLSGKDVVILYIHALNPYGFSHFGRGTHENVDLNRNFLNFQLPLPVNPGYGMLHRMLIPDRWPPTASDNDNMLRLFSRMDMASLKSTLERGQYEFHDGLFYGGKQACWSNLTLRTILRKYAKDRKTIAWIDIHSGLGECGSCERAIFARHDPSTIQRVNAWWNPEGDQDIASDYLGTSLSSVCDGLMWNVMYDECPSAVYAGITLEFGTLSLMEVLAALRAEQWRRTQHEISHEQREEIDKKIMDAFFCDSLSWKFNVVRRGILSIEQAVEALSIS